MEAVHDLYSLACSEDEEKWQDILQPNIQHILTSVLRGVAYLHKEGYQHRDLKGTRREQVGGGVGGVGAAGE